MASVASPSGWVSDEEIAALSSSLSESGPAVASRRRALEAFRELPLEPNPLYRKYGYLGGVDLTGLRPTERSPPVPLPPQDPMAIRIVHDGSGTRVDMPTTLRSAGVAVETVGEGLLVDPNAPRPTDRLAALAQSTANRGCRVTVPDECPESVRVQDLTILGGPHQAISVRRQLDAGAGSHVLWSEETYSSPTPGGNGQGFLGASTSIRTGAGARVAALTLHAPGFETVASYDRAAELGPASRVAWIWSGFGGLRTRIRNRSALTGNGSHLLDLQTFFGIGNQSYDSAVDITHLGTDTHGQSITRGVFRDTSRGMSRGLVRIEKEARKTVSYLSEHSMLLSKGTRSDTIPILEILCRDVKATHSTSVAPVDPEKVFYLESRGIETTEAVRMIGEGFLSNVWERSPIAGLRELAYPFLDARWQGTPIEWRAGAFPLLPPMELSGSEAAPEWRFDAKLR